ncbi:NAD(P)/FAD-dependent oxidoreductase [Streptomyces tagetis]|uniref:NAD(P)/FAD-dependent oxidoreductase n=1 Tax=Streptomyces tagetis TaxID=2820809 RepID=A0A941B3M6_9ACTN|nr:NAD(P)/FAD-dependent oxidoreductase [Streptomyces sp. RG38]MBQ0830530.1 NAD(P)/FAD-dependent oxidoreductase [Streptomyces sp. RG38]
MTRSNGRRDATHATHTTHTTHTTHATHATHATSTDAYEVVVVGGGAAGLSAALVLGRSRRSVLVVDAGEPRNAPSDHMQGYLTRDGMPPADFLALGRAEIARYGVGLVHDRAVDVVRDGDFAVRLAGGRTVRARRLIVATGLRDELPGVPGVAARFGRDVLHCPFCHGWEVRDGAFGVLATGPLAVHQALMVSGWSDDVVLFAHTLPGGEPSATDLRRLAAAGVEVVRGEVTGLRVEDDRLTGVRLADGSVRDRTALFVAPRAVPGTGLLERLGAEAHETPNGTYPVVDATGRTSVPGVWAAGNATGFAEQVVNAAGAGHRAAAAVVGDLIMSGVDAALARQDADLARQDADLAGQEAAQRV